MYCKPKTLFSILVLSTIAHHLNCVSFSAEKDAVYSGRTRFHWDSRNLADETRITRRIRSGASEVNVKRMKRATSKLDFTTSSKGHQNETQSFYRLDNGLSTHSYNENGSVIRSFSKRAFDIDAGFQQDATVFEEVGASLPAQPMVHCSGDVMTLTARGREYSHILVDRADASPLYLYQMPSDCGYNIKVTWRDLVLMAPYDGCYITQENGSYVLSLLWWGKPLKISCPMTRVNSQPTSSVFCSHFGMIVQVKGAQEPVAKHAVKVNGKAMPLLSETCAYRVTSPPDVVVLLTAFSSRCVTSKAGEMRLVIIVDGKQFTLSCPFPHHLPPFLPYLHSHPFHQHIQHNLEQQRFIPHVPASITVTGTLRQPTTSPKTPETSKPPAVPQFLYEPPLVPQSYPDYIKHPHTSVQDTYHNHHMFPPGIYQHPKPPPQTHSSFPPRDTSGFSSQQYLSVPVPQIQQIPAFHTLTSHGIITEDEKVPQQQYHPMMPPPRYSPNPVFCPPYPDSFCSEDPHHDPRNDLTSPDPTYMPPTPLPQQFTLFPQLPIFSPVAPEHPPKISSPSLNCMRNRITAVLPSAKIDSVKVKDKKTNTWVSIASVPADCNYTLRSRGGAVVLSSPLPACHTQKPTSDVIALSIRFWDSSRLRIRTIQLQCLYTQSRVPPDPVKPLHQIIPHITPTPARQPANVQVLCSSQHMNVKVPPGPTSGLVVDTPFSGIKTQTEAVPLLEAPSHCGYSVKRSKDGALNILLPYSSCHMIHEGRQHKIVLKYQTLNGRTVETLLSCQASDSQECNVAIDQQLICGSGVLSSTACQEKGCCYSLDRQMCYYPMDECTVDRHFVFSVHSSVSNPPLSPSTLITAGNGSCSPQKVTADFALFKIPLDECGVHRYEVGKTIIYMVEILNRVQSVSLNYGTITRDSPVRLLVECRYFPGSVVSVGYLVKSPSLGPSIKAQGVFGVQLRIAKDEHYNDFYPQYHQPLRMLLGKPLYLEVRLLNPPDPTAILLVHYCVAYPRSANSAWILIYDGCPNSLDQTPAHKPPATPAETLTNHVRRFTITTFQFLPKDDNLQTDEEIYFMCSTEVCLPSDGLCVEGCFEDPADVKW